MTMAEVMTPPDTYVDSDGDEVFAFGPDHSIADIARWMMQNRSEAEELHSILGAMLNETYDRVLQ
jgi:hypothetical protein